MVRSRRHYPHTQPHDSMGSYCLDKRKRIGPYKTKEEAIRAAKDENLFGFFDKYVIDVDELTGAKRNKE